MSSNPNSAAPVSDRHEDVLLRNLQQLMQKAKLNEAELARRTKIPQPTLHKILAGRTEDPRISTLQALANYFEVTVDALFSTLPEAKQHIEKMLNVKSIPIISWEGCLKPHPTANLNSNNHIDWVVVEHIQTESAYVLTGRPSLEPAYPRGTLFIVSPQLQPADGDLVIVHYPGTQEATLRELSIDGPNRLLIPVNRNMATPDQVTKDIRIVGTVIQSRYEHRG